MAMSKLDFTTPDEKDTIEKTYRQAMNCLAEEDRDLP
jgi:ATP-dependent RNA helicase DOB1